MQNKPIEAITEVTANATHHHRDAACSTTPEILSVIQLKFRRFRTNGTRASGRSAETDASPSIMSGTVDALSISYPGSAGASPAGELNAQSSTLNAQRPTAEGPINFARVKSLVINRCTLLMIQ